MNGLNRYYFGRSLAFAGGSLVALGIILLLVKLLIFVAYYAAGAIALAGLVLLGVGWLLQRS